jgi:hypothetical protein
MRGSLGMRPDPSPDALVEVRIVTYVTDYPEALKPGYVVLGMRRPVLWELIDVVNALTDGRVSR